MVTNNSSNTYIVATTTHEVTMPLQPSFLAFTSSVQSNVTGNGAQYRCVFDSEVYDKNNDYDGNTTFTAPVNGVYLFASNCFFQNVVGLSINFKFEGTANANDKRNVLIATCADNNNDWVLNQTSGMKLDAGDTLDVEAAIYAGGANTVDLYGNATNRYTSFGGYLVC